MKKKMNDHYTFELLDSVTRTKVHFTNHFGIELTGDVYAPKSAAKTGNAALAVCGPFGAVKEQASGLYAMHMASRGFVALAFDPSYCGESGGVPRYMNSPDINTEDFMAAVDFLSVQQNIDAEKIGIIGICGWGGIALNAAAADPRIKATVASTMYDLSRVAAKGYNDASDNEEARYKARVAIAAQRIADCKTARYKRAGGVVDPLPDDAPQFAKDYHAYYKTPRGYHERSLNSNDGWAVQAGSSLANTKLLAYVDEIRSAVMVLHGENAHSRYMGEDAFKSMTAASQYAANKELVIVPGASHCDLYDNLAKIPFEHIAEFFTANVQ
ncbi:MAG: alpha/beta hydrolase [Treponema sp.]|nr:alpha/beta hydrolase [Treponema sp.]